MSRLTITLIGGPIALSLSRSLCFAGAMVPQTLQTGLCPCGDAELDQTACAMIGKKSDVA
jgi:hypothetical protein